MAKLFFKTSYSIFLWILLFVNIIFAFDLTYLLGGFVNIRGGSYADKYFGLSTLINAFRGLQTMPLGMFTTKIGSFMKDVWALTSTMFNDFDWPDFAKVNNLWDFFFNVLEVLKNIGQFIGGMYMFVFAIGISMVYFSLLVLNMFFTILMFASGYYYSSVPQSLVFSEESNMLLNIPLLYRFCCC